MNIQKQIKMAHSASVLISLLVNGALVVLLLFFIQLSGPETTPVANVKVIEPTEQVEVEVPEEEIVPEVVETQEFQETDFTMDTPIQTEFTPETEVVQPVSDTNVNQLTELLSDIVSPVTITGVMQGRTSLSRKKALGQYGGNTGGVSEPAVMKALEWLRDHQDPDGSWDQNGDVAAGKGNAAHTGLALLAFLAHGETPSSAEFGPTVAKAIRFLVENQDSNGIFQPAGPHTSYGHAMATYALAEAYTMTQNPLIKDAVQRGAQVIINGMQANGGFDYDYNPGPRNDSSVGAWNIQALKAVKVAGVDIPDIEARVQKSMDGMMVNSKATDTILTFGYASPGNYKAISAAGTLCLHLCGRGKSKEAGMGIENLTLSYTQTGTVPTWGNSVAGNHGGEIYMWYYAVQAFFHHDPGGDVFLKYYRPMVNALVKNQNSDGSWLCFTEKGAQRGAVFNTSLASLSLMVTYRHLPSTQAENIKHYSAPEPPPAAQDGVAEFEI